VNIVIPTTLKIRLLERGYSSFRDWARQAGVSHNTARDVAAGRLNCERNPKKGASKAILNAMIRDLGFDPREHHQSKAA
jgi:hypothetical protein